MARNVARQPMRIRVMFRNGRIRIIMLVAGQTQEVKLVAEKDRTALDNADLVPAVARSTNQSGGSNRQWRTHRVLNELLHFLSC